MASKFPQPWVSLLAEGQAESAKALRTECERELARDHPLYGRIDQAVARCSGCDDVLFRLGNDQGFALVHLTWRQSVETPPWPETTFLPTFVALELVMDQHEHRDEEL